jgi:hypothetical protein
MKADRSIRWATSDPATSPFEKPSGPLLGLIVMSH